MITDEPEDWGTPLGDWFDTLVFEKPKVIKIKVLTPDGERDLTPIQVRNAVVLGLSVRRAEHE